MDILIVEDEDSLRQSLTEGLLHSLPDMKITGAGSVEEAEGLLSGAPPRLIISDVRLPGKDGVELLIDVRNRWSTIPFIFMSAYPSPEAQQQANERGIRFLCKPFDFDDLLEAVEIGLDQNQFSGELGGISVVDLLQMLNMGRRTAAVTLKRRGETGKIFLSDGEIVHAEVGDFKGREAFDRLMAWKGGSFGSEPDCKSPATTISEPFNGLLLDCFRLQDEGGDDAGSGELVDDLFAGEESAESPTQNGAESASELIADALEIIPGCVATGCIDVSAGTLLGLTPDDLLSAPITDLIPETVRSLFEHSALCELDSALAGDTEAKSPDLSLIKEIIVLSDDLTHHFMSEKGHSRRVFAVVSRTQKNLGIVVSKARAWLGTLNQGGESGG